MPQDKITHTAQVSVKTNLVKFIGGRNRQTFKELEDKYQCKISIKKGGTYSDIELNGHYYNQLDKARKEITQLYNQAITMQQDKAERKKQWDIHQHEIAHEKKVEQLRQANINASQIEKEKKIEEETKSKTSFKKNPYCNLMPSLSSDEEEEEEEENQNANDISLPSFDFPEPEEINLPPKQKYKPESRLVETKTRFVLEVPAPKTAQEELESKIKTLNVLSNKYQKIVKEKQFSNKERKAILKRKKAKMIRLESEINHLKKLIE